MSKVKKGLLFGVWDFLAPVARAPGKSAFEPAGPMCKPEASRTGSTLEIPGAVRNAILRIGIRPGS